MSTGLAVHGRRANVAGIRGRALIPPEAPHHGEDIAPQTKMRYDSTMPVFRFLSLNKAAMRRALGYGASVWGIAFAMVALTFSQHDAVFAIDPPILAEVTPVTTPTNDTTPDYTFSSDEEGTITYVGACTSATTNAVVGNNTITFDAFADGSYAGVDTCTITVTDAESNASDPLYVTGFTIDTTPPATPDAPDMTVGTDSGSANMDNVTNDTTPDFAGSCTWGDTIDILRHGLSPDPYIYGTAVCSGSNNYTITASEMVHEPGGFAVYVRATDPAGNSAESASTTIYIDTEGETLSLEGGALSGSTNDTSPSVDLISLAPGLSYSYGGSCGNGDLASTSSPDVITYDLSDGTYTDCTVSVTDVAGNVSNALSIGSFSVDTAAPTVTAYSGDIAPTANLTLTFDDDVVANTGQIEIRKTEDDSLVESIDVTAGAVVISGSGVTIDHFDLDDLTDYYVLIPAAAFRDDAGNDFAGINDPATWAFTTGDSTPPTLQSLTSTTPNGTYGPGSSILIIATYNEALGAGSTLTVTLDNGASVALSTVSGMTASGAYVVGATGSAQDSSDLTVAAIASESVEDIYANERTDSSVPGSPNNLGDSSAIVIDTTAPSAPGVPDLASDSDTGSSSTDNVTTDTTPTFTISSCTNGLTVTLSGASLTATGTCSGGSVTITLGTIGTDGTYAFKAFQTDAVGNISAQSSALPVTIDTAQSAPGTPDLHTDSDTGTSITDNLTNDTTPTFTVSCETNATVTLSGASLTATGTCSGGSVTITMGTIGADGTYPFKAYQTDPAGNVSAQSSALSMTVDTAASSAPGTPDLQTASDSGASSTDNITTDTTPGFSVSCSGTDVVAIRRNGTSVATGTCSGGIVSVSPGSAWSDGTFAVTATQTDAAGNVSNASSALSVTVDTAAPASPAVDVSDALLQDADDGDTFTVTVTFAENMDESIDLTVTFSSPDDDGTLTGCSGSWNSATEFAYDCTVGDQDADAGNIDIVVEDGVDVAGNPMSPSTEADAFDIDMGGAPVCGDGVTESAEECDDGNSDNDDACTNACAAAACGDGYVWSGIETCDDGNASAGDGCSALCSVETGWSCSEEPSICTENGDGNDGGSGSSDDAGTDPSPASGARRGNGPSHSTTDGHRAADVQSTTSDTRRSRHSPMLPSALGKTLPELLGAIPSLPCTSVDRGPGPKPIDASRLGSRVSRGAVFIIIAERLCLSLSHGPGPFDDVDPAAVYAPAIRALFEIGALRGYTHSDGAIHRYVGPNDPALPEHVLLLLARLRGAGLLSRPPRG